MDDTATPRDRSGAHAPVDRRVFLAAGAVALVAGAAGGALLGHSSDSAPESRPPATVSAELVAAAAAERTLIAGIDAALRGANDASSNRLLTLRRDHVAHLAALNSAIDQALASVTRSTSSAPTPRPPASGSTAAVRAAEAKAATAAAARAARLSGAPAALLASIAACEATHAELLA